MCYITLNPKWCVNYFVYFIKLLFNCLWNFLMMKNCLPLNAYFQWRLIVALDTENSEAKVLNLPFTICYMQITKYKQKKYPLLCKMVSHHHPAQ